MPRFPVRNRFGSLLSALLLAVVIVLLQSGIGAAKQTNAKAAWSLSSPRTANWISSASMPA